MINYFGLKTAEFLVKYQPEISKFKTALDVGCAHGANSVYLADLGMKVTAIDIQLPENLAEHERISYVEENVIAWKPPERYDLIIAFNVLQFIEKAEQAQILEKLYQVLNTQGLLLIKAFSDKDISFQKRKRGHFHHNELKDWALAHQLQIIEYAEKEIEDNHEPLGKHNHSIVCLAARKLAASAV